MLRVQYSVSIYENVDFEEKSKKIGAFHTWFCRSTQRIDRQNINEKRQNRIRRSRKRLDIIIKTNKYLKVRIIIIEKKYE